MRAHHISENAETDGRSLGGPVTPDLTMWDFNKSDCLTKYRKLVHNSKPLLLIGSPLDFAGGVKQQARAGDDAPTQRDLTCASATVTTNGR